MQKMMKSWIFTLITCILLTILSVLMFLDGFDIGGLHIGERLIHLVAGIALILYVVFALFPLSWRYKGTLRFFEIGEIAILLLTAVAHICVEWFTVPLVSALQVCSVLGLAVWLRGAVETVHAYISAAEEQPPKRVPLWKLLAYILLSAVGVWQLIRPTVSDRAFIFVIAGAAGVMAILFGALTAANRKAGAEERKAKKAEKLAKKQAELQAKQELALLQQAQAQAQAQAQEQEQQQAQAQELALIPEKTSEE